ncbi:MAG TPA: hypothetical protein P5044_02005 [bacterium]|nr:hypothetical protein [bacterium]
MKHIFLPLLFLFFFSGCGLQKFDSPEKDDDSFSGADEDAFSDDPDSVQDADEEEDGDETPDSDDSKCGSVYFNGFDSYISVEHDDALNLGNTWTIEAWAMQDNAENQDPLIRKGDSTESPSYWIYGKDSAVLSTFSSSPNGGYQFGTTGDEDVWLKSSKEVQNLKWYHVALVKSETELKLFVDGILQTKESANKSPVKNSEDLYFGARLNNKPSYFYGLIDEIRFSSIPRYSENFTPEKRLSADSSTTTVWHFEETSGTETASEGKNILKGVFNGSVQFVNECAENENECVNECFFEGETQCGEGILSTCVKDDNGCLKFNTEECLTGICADNFICAVDDCLFAGMTECVSGSARICRELQNGILNWSLPVACSDGICADNASCLSCSNECEFDGFTVCSDGKISACVNNNGCNKWEPEHKCSLNKCENSINCKSDGWINVSGGYYKCGINGSGELYCWRDSPYPEKMSNRTDWSKVSVSSYDTSLSYFCAIASGELYCMGYNANGELGDGTNISKTELVRIGSRSDWSDISAYFYIQNDLAVYATCGLAGGELFCWGAGVLSPQKMGTKSDWGKITGSCGIASGKIFCWETLSSQPVQIGDRENWDQTTSYSYLEEFKYYCAISSGELFCWGNNDYGQLGDGTFESRSEPVKIGARNDWEIISVRYTVTCGIAGGELFCWGQNVGALNGGDTVESVNIPTKIGTMNNWSTLTYFGLCGVESGNFYCFESKEKNPLTKVGTLNEWTHISTATQKRCGISGGSLYCSDYLVNSASYTDFAKITDNSGWGSVSTGDYHSCAIRNEDLYCWGNNHLGQVGDSSFENRDDPVQIGSDKKWESVSCGVSHTCGISAGELFCWGNNGDGQAGGGVYADTIDSPAKIGKKNKWEKISAGSAHTCGIESGELYCWGDEIVYEPLKISDRSDWEQIVSDGNSSCGIAGGEIFCWGKITANLTGKLRNIPTKVWNYSDFKKISATGDILCGLRNDNNLYCLSYSSFASGYYVNDLYPEKVDDIEWDSISENGLICGISDKKELYCPFMRQSSLLLQMLINP